MKPLPLFLCVVLAAPLAAEFKPELELGSGVTMGSANEYVLRDGTYKDPVSRLVWDIPLSSVIEVSGRLPWSALTSTKISLRGALPFAAGTMVDEDWDVADRNLKYGRSQHTLYMNSHWSASLEQTLDFDAFRILAGVNYRWTSWEGWNGKGSYFDYSDTEDVAYFSGMVITYRQQWILPYLGGSYTLDTDSVQWTGTLRFGPMTWCNDVDTHFYAGEAAWTFLDYLRGGAYVQSSVEAVWPQDTWAWGVRLEGALTFGAIGDTVETSTQQSSSELNSTYGKFTNSAGAWFREASVSFFVRN